VIGVIAGGAVAVLLAKLVWNLVMLGSSMRFLAFGPKALTPPAFRGKIFVVIPLLREQARLEGLLNIYSALVHKFEALHLVLITGEREFLEYPGTARENSTPDLIDHSLVFAAIPVARRHHFHLPKDNDTIAEVLNFGLDTLRERRLAADEDFILIYNADSSIEPGTIVAFLEKINRGHKVIQQSSLFTKNFNQLVEARAYLAAGDAIYQSLWTLKREIPRYLVAAGYLKWPPAFIQRHWMAHCVGHGIMIEVQTLAEIGGLPRPRFGLEDSALGFLFRARGIPIAPLNVLENSDAAESIGALFRQKSIWVRGPLGAFEYLAMSARDGRASLHAFLLSLQCFYNGCKWSVATFFLVLAFIAAIRVGRGGAFLILYGVYCWLPFLVFFRFWKTLPASLFPCPRHTQMLTVFILYPFVPVLHGVSGGLGAVRLLWEAVTGARFRQRKTEAVE
jgi:hypothetical protein